MVTTAETTVTATMPHCTILQRIPWLWYEYVVARARLPLRAICLILFAITYGIGALIAFRAGILPRYLGDYPSLVNFALPALAAYTLGYAPRALDYFWRNIRPWLANSEEEITTLQAAAPNLLMRFFWVGMVIAGGGTALYAFFPQEPSIGTATLPEIFRDITLLAAPFMGYFFGGAISVATFGLGLFARSIGQDLDLKEGFVVQGGKSALQPFNWLLWVVWATFTLPLIVSTLLSFAIQPAATDPLFITINLITIAVVVVFTIPTIVVPQLFMNRFLAREKTEELKALQRELGEVADFPAPQDPSVALPRLIRHQHLVYQIQQVQSFTPTLVDARFVVQIGTSVVVILIANIVMRTVFAGLLG